MPAKSPSRYDSNTNRLPWIVIGSITAATITFGFAQNAGWFKGGAISPPKILWLNFALIAFFALPALITFTPGATRRERRLFKIILASFAIRAIIEFYLIYATNLWRCEIGIAHTLFTATLTLIYWTPARGVTLLVLATMLTESVMADLFSRAADPAQGIFFAAPTAHFAAINTFTWIVVIILYPWLFALLLRNQGLFRRHA